MADGHLNKCKICVKKRVSSYRKNNIKRVRAYDRKRGLLKSRVEDQERYRKTEAGKLSCRKAFVKWSQRNKHKRSAHSKVRNAILSGVLIKLDCEICGNVKSEAHHSDYSKPLKVKWLCKKHHAELHKNNGDYRKKDFIKKGNKKWKK